MANELKPCPFCGGASEIYAGRNFPRKGRALLESEKEARDKLAEYMAIGTVVDYCMRGVAILNNFPAADVVEVVRCRNCKHFPKGVVVDFCRRKPNGDAVTADDFCSYGERKDNA